MRLDAEAFIVQILFKSKANSKEEYKQMLIIYLDARPYCEFGEESVMDAVFQTTSRALIFIDPEGSILLQTS